MPRNTSGLNKGRVPGANYIPVGEQNVRAREEMEQIEEDVRTAPDDVILKLHARSSRVAIRWLTRLERSKEEPSRNVLELIRECRQLSDRAAEIEQARASVASQDGFFAHLEARLEAASAVLDGGVQPIPLAGPVGN